MASFLSKVAKDVAGSVISGAINKALGGIGTPQSTGLSVQNILSTINKSGVAKSSHFEVQVIGPKGPLTNKLDTNYEREMIYRADSCELPGRTIQTTDYKFSNYGPMSKLAYGQQYSDSSVSFIMSEDLREKEYFELWQDSMVNTGAFEVGGGQPNRSTSKFNARYFDNYAGTIIIRQYATAGDLRSIHTLKECYPIIINPISMTWGEDNLVRMSVTFAFRYYTAVFNKQDQAGMGYGFSLKLGKGGLQGSLRLPGIGTIAGGGGFGTQANLDPLKKRIVSAIL